MLTTQIAATLIRETPKALLVLLTASGKELWVPKSIGRIEKTVKIQYHPATALPAEFRKPDATVLVVPAWWWERTAG